jgi:hypothetical protein
LPASKTLTSSFWKPEPRNPIHEETELEALPPQDSNVGNLIPCSKGKWEVIQKKRVKQFSPQELLKSTWINPCKKAQIDVKI